MPDWRYRSEQRRKHIEGLMEQAGALKENDALKAEFAKYLCVLISGYFEQCFQEMALAYVQRRSNDLLPFFDQQIIKRRWIDFDTAKLKAAVKPFESAKYPQQFESFLDTKLADALNTLHINRNQIAHGNVHNANITLALLKENWSALHQILKFLEERIFKLKKTK